MALLNTSSAIHSIQKIFEGYIKERRIEQKFIFYIPSRNKEAKDRIMRFDIQDLADNDNLFPFFYIYALKTFSLLKIGNSFLQAKTKQDQLRVVANEFLFPITVEKESALLGYHVLYDQSDNRMISTSLLMHLIEEFEKLIGKKPTFTAKSEREVAKKDWEENPCILISDYKYINLMHELKTSIEYSERVCVRYRDSGGKQEMVSKPNLEVVTNLITPMLFGDMYYTVKDILNNGEGLQKVNFDAKREMQQAVQAPLPQRPQQKNGKKKGKK